MSDYFRDSTGLAVLTATDAIQYAWEQESDSAEQIAEPSLFSGHIIDGLRTGNADLDGDGQMTLEDLFHYVSTEMRAKTPAQRPQRSYFGLDGQIVVAGNPLPYPGTLPRDIAELMDDSRPDAQLRAVSKLRRLLGNHHPSRPIGIAARHALERLHARGSRRVSEAAIGVLADLSE
jgi:hypothetical protein